MEIRSSGRLRTGKWCKEEDDLLKACVLKYGEGHWHLIPQRSGLRRCRKSCRLRWLNYLKPDIKREHFSEDEIDMIIRLHKLLGNRWSLIAGRLPGRTANGVKNYWNTHMREKGRRHGSCEERDGLEEKSEETSMRSHTPTVIKPQAFRLSRSSPSSSSWCWWRNNIGGGGGGEVITEDHNSRSRSGPDEQKNQEGDEEWWKHLLLDDDSDIQNTKEDPTPSWLSISSSSTASNFDPFWDQKLTWIDDFPLHTTLTDFLA